MEIFKIKDNVKKLENIIINKENNIVDEVKTLDTINGRKISHIQDIEDDNALEESFYNPLYNPKNYWY